MEFDQKPRENMSPQGQPPPMLSSDNNNCLKPFETTTPTSKDYYLQDFHHIDHDHDHQAHVNGLSSSSNPVFGVHNTACYDSFDAFPYGCSSNNNVDFYECKPFAAAAGESSVLGHGQVMDNFQSVGLLNLCHQRNSSNDVVMMGSDHVGYNPFDFHDHVTTKSVNFVMADEVSCVTAENGHYNKNRGLLANSTSRRTNWKGRKKSNGVKGQWTMEEDRLLIQLVEQFGVRKWSHIAQMLPGRIGKQCRERWHNHLRPDIKKDTWSEEEDKVLIQSHIEIGNKWAEIAKRLPGRTENSIKNHWNATKRRQFSKRKCRPKYPRGSILQEYIKSLNLDVSSSSTTKVQEKASDNYKTISSSKPQASEFCPTTTSSSSTDRLVPEYEFCFDEKLLQESCSIDSLLEQIPNAAAAPMAHDHMDMIGPVKKELDLVEMISAHPTI